MDPEAALIGRTIAGRYTIERCIGRGGMASVFAARQDAEPREVAVKIMKRELMKDATVVKRFRREAKAAAMLDHPNTVKILDYGVDGEDAYIAMELAKGKDLFQALAEDRPMTQARSALIVAQVGAALSAAHAQGIVHRDLKPENVMLVPRDDVPGGELVKVLDFGIAKILDAPGGDAKPTPAGVARRTETSTNLTRAGTVVGTPAYMSPEQCRGGELDGRSDVYSSGVLLYQLVTGQLPFMGETPLHTAMRHIHAPPRPPSEIRAGLDKALERIVLKALSKLPADRQQSAEELRQELLAVVDTLPDRDRVLGARGGRPDPRKEPDDDVETGQREVPGGGGPPATKVPSTPRAIQRQPTEAQVGMRLGGGLGKLVSPASTKSPAPAPAPAPLDTDDELERSETPARIIEPKLSGSPAATAPRGNGSVGVDPGSESVTSPSLGVVGSSSAGAGPAGAPRGGSPSAGSPLAAAPTSPAAGPSPRPQWGDDDERTRLRPAGPAPSAPDDDDDGPRTALMTSDHASRRARPNRTMVMGDEPSSAGEAPPSAPGDGRGGGAPGLGEQNVRSTVRLGSHAPLVAAAVPVTAAPSPAGMPGPARKDITAAAFARTHNAGSQSLVAALMEEESKSGRAPDPAFSAAIKATMRMVDEPSTSGGTNPGIGPAMIAPPLAPPPPPPRPVGVTDTGGAAAPRRDGVRGSLEQLPGTTVLVVGVALGVVFSALVILLIVFLARG